MIRYETQTTIDRPSDVVMAALLDAPRYEQWTDMTDMQFEGTGPARVGTRGRFRLPKSPFRGPLDVEIVELEPERRIVFRVTHPALTWINWAEVAPEGRATRFTYGGEMRLHGWQRLLEPLIRGEVTRTEAGEAQRLKALLEAEAPVAVDGA